ncbi:MAG: ABC transporter permease subunit [Acidobacteriota bacterium]
MKAKLLEKELLQHRRNRRFGILGVLAIALVAVAAVDGWNRAQEAARHREAAVAADREVWVEQGENNPHGAAHFARYAFRPTPALGAFDSGISDYAGSAVWLEAHYQNPATLRRAEDVGARAPFTTLDPAWAVRVLGSLALAVLLFASIAGEREAGTLRSLLTQGVRPGTLVAVKAVAALLVVLALVGVAFAVALLPGVVAGAPLDLPRVLLLGASYTLGLAAFAFSCIALSATATSRGAALTTVGSFWVVVTLVLPMFAGQLSGSLSDTPDGSALNRAIFDEAQAPFWAGEAGPPAIRAFEEEIADRYGAASFEELGFDRAGMELQAHEEFANAVYDRLFGELYAAQRGQASVLRAAAWFSPLLALQRVSSGLSGTDLSAQLAFAAEAESHRRKMVELLNRDMMEQGGGAGFTYMADRSLWERTPDFAGVLPRTPTVVGTYWPEFAVLLAWAIGALLLASGLTARASRIEVA